MGKQTLFHPVSLYVIRGSLEACGWKIGRLTQTKLSTDRSVARYVGIIENAPRGMAPDPDLMVQDMQDCFAADITVKWVKLDSRGRVAVTLETRVTNDD